MGYKEVREQEQEGLALLSTMWASSGMPCRLDLGLPNERWSPPDPDSE